MTHQKDLFFCNNPIEDNSWANTNGEFSPSEIVAIEFIISGLSPVIPGYPQADALSDLITCAQNSC